MAEPRTLYFGYNLGGGGHNLMDEEGYSVWGKKLGNFPWNGREIDSKFCPKEDVAGTGAFHQIKGWTILGVWDRSGDDRGASNSEFFVEGTITLEELKAQAERVFPALWQRLIKAYPDIKIIKEEAHGEEPEA